MICPLLTIARPVKPRIEEFGDRDCVKGDCAWWNVALECCDITNIATDLQSIANSLFTIANEMPTPRKR